jgi:hypothetical protein
MSLNNGNHVTRAAPLVTSTSTLQPMPRSRTQSSPKISSSSSHIPPLTQINGKLSSLVKICPSTVSTQPRNKSVSRPTPMNGTIALPVTASSHRNKSQGPKSTSATSSPNASLTPTARIPSPVLQSSNSPPIHNSMSIISSAGKSNDR